MARSRKPRTEKQMEMYRLHLSTIARSGGLKANMHKVSHTDPKRADARLRDFSKKEDPCSEQ